MDVAVIETLNGGDIQVEGNDLALVYGIENMPYLCWFGGNLGFPTAKRQPKEEVFDWWGNGLFMLADPMDQFNSLLEKKLQTVALNSSGRLEIEQAAKLDLKSLEVYGKYSVLVAIVSDDVVSITLRVELFAGGVVVRTVLLRKKEDGDFVFDDFNDDFYVL
jgi:hypothetical protein